MLLSFHRAGILPIFFCSLLSVGCADTMRSTVAPDLRGKAIPVERIGVTGPGASIATQEFLARGYKIVELGGPGTTGIDDARKRGVPFVAVVDDVDTSQAVWDGLYSFSMRVSETKSGAVVWSSSGTFGQGGLFINKPLATKNAMKSMVSDFAKTFPPAKG